MTEHDEWAERQHEDEQQAAQERVNEDNAPARPGDERPANDIVSDWPGCPTSVCEMARHDKVTCADDECDIASGIRSLPAGDGERPTCETVPFTAATQAQMREPLEPAIERSARDGERPSEDDTVANLRHALVVVGQVMGEVALGQHGVVSAEARDALSRFAAIPVNALGENPSAPAPDALIAEMALAYHKVEEGEYGCPGRECPGVQRLLRFARSIADTGGAEDRRRLAQLRAWLIDQRDHHLGVYHRAVRLQQIQRTLVELDRLTAGDRETPS